MTSHAITRFITREFVWFLKPSRKVYFNTEVILRFLFCFVSITSGAAVKVSTLSLWLPPYFLFAANLVYLLTSTCKFALANQVQSYIWPAIRSCLYHHLALSKSTAPSRRVSKRMPSPSLAAVLPPPAGFNSSWENRQVSSFLLKLYWYMAFELFIQGALLVKSRRSYPACRWVLCME